MQWKFYIYPGTFQDDGTFKDDGDDMTGHAHSNMSYREVQPDINPLFINSFIEHLLYTIVVECEVPMRPDV